MSWRQVSIDTEWTDNVTRGIPVCQDPSHNPPMTYFYDCGVYEWKCPKCGHGTKIQIVKRSFEGVPTSTQARLM
jgi:hypothetical protein